MTLILRTVLIVGCITTMLSSCLFAIETLPLHCIQIASLTLLLALIRVAIAEIDHPFHGTGSSLSMRLRTRPRYLRADSLACRFGHGTAAGQVLAFE
jgi:hypothetical protein